MHFEKKMVLFCANHIQRSCYKKEMRDEKAKHYFVSGMEAVRKAADKGETGFKTIWKLLNDSRFYK